MEGALRACGMVGVRPRFFVLEALRRALTPEALWEILRAQDAHDAYRYRRRRAQKAIFKYKNVL